MNIFAGSLEYKDLIDIDNSEQKGFNVGISANLGVGVRKDINTAGWFGEGPKNPSGKNDGAPSGNTTIGITNKGKETEGVTHQQSAMETSQSLTAVGRE